MKAFLKRNWRQMFILAFVIVLTILLVLEFAPTEGTPTIVAALIAAIVALTINETVSERQERDAKSQADERRNRSEQREREAEALKEERQAEARRHERELETRLREQREEAYSEVLSHLFSSFGDAPQGKSEFHIRNKIVMWGSVEFMEAYMAWRSSIEGLSGRGQVSIPVDRKPSIERALARVAMAARNDLGVHTRHAPKVEYVINILFDHASPVNSDSSSDQPENSG